MASFNSIDDDCARLILIQIALSSRISLRLICKRWKSLIDSQCRKVRALRLIGPVFYPGQEEPGPFPYKYFTEHFCQVQHLNIEINRYGTLQFDLASIMQCWRSTLTHFSIDNLPREIPRSLLNECEWFQLNEMHKLESLHLSNMIRHQVPHPKYLSFVGQLKCLSFKGYNAAHLIPLIYSLGAELRDLHLQIEYFTRDTDKFSLDVLEKVFEDCKEMTSGVTRLKIDHPCKNDIDSKVQFGEMVCAYFCSVTELDFLPEIPMQLMLPHLASLTNLTKLGLSLHEQTDFTNFTHDYSLESVKFLSLNLLTFEEGNLPNILEQICAIIPTTFPALDELLVIVDAPLIDYRLGFIEELKQTAQNVCSCKVRVEIDPKEVAALNLIRERAAKLKLPTLSTIMSQRFLQPRKTGKIKSRRMKRF